MNWARASGASIFRSDALVCCSVLTMLPTVAYFPVGRITRRVGPHLSARRVPPSSGVWATSQRARCAA
jgi:hypothetical protein